MKKLSETLELSLRFFGPPSFRRNEQLKSSFMCYSIEFACDNNLITKEERDTAHNYIRNILGGNETLWTMLFIEKHWSVKAATNVNLRRQWYLKRISELKATGN